MLQFSEILIILILALVLLGPTRLPQVARKLGQWTAEFRHAAQQLTAGIESEIAEAVQPLDDIRRDLAATIEEVDPTRYQWKGPEPASGPTSGEAMADLEDIERINKPGDAE